MYGGKRTKQKDIIHEHLKALPHPSATTVYESVHVQHPAISRATVFRVLSQFADEGYVKKLEFSSGDIRFDWQTFNHYHYRCRCCSKVGDVDMDYMSDIQEKAKGLGGFLIESHDVQFIGLCEDCRKNSLN